MTDTLLDIERGRVIPFPLERAAKEPKLQMAKASLESSVRGRDLIPQVFRTSYPATCGPRGCGHVRCGVVRMQAKVPCEDCHQLVQEGERVHVMAVENGYVTKQRHAECPERGV